MESTISSSLHALNEPMIFGKLLNNGFNGGALKPSGDGNEGQAKSAPSLGVNAGERLEITNVWSGPIIILSSESQVELEKHYLSYSSTITEESFEAIFRGRTVIDET